MAWCRGGVKCAHVYIDVSEYLATEYLGDIVIRNKGNMQGSVEQTRVTKYTYYSTERSYKLGRGAGNGQLNKRE